MRRTGNALVLVLVGGVLVLGGVLVASPDTAQDVLPASVLPVLPQFEQVDTDRNCDALQQAADTAEQIAGEVDADVNSDDVLRVACVDKCEAAGHQTAGTTCGDGALGCICRTSG